MQEGMAAGMQWTKRCERERVECLNPNDSYIFPTTVSARIMSSHPQHDTQNRIQPPQKDENLHHDHAAVCFLSLHLLLVGVVRLLLARADNDVHKAAVVKEALVGSATGLLLLVGLLDLGGLRLDLTGTCEGTVDFACDEKNKGASARHRKAVAEIRNCEIESWSVKGPSSDGCQVHANA